MTKTLEVRSPYDGRIVDTLSLSSSEMIDGILDRARHGAAEGRALSRYARGDILDQVSRIVVRDAEAIASLIVAEAGKPIRQARKEVTRCANTLRLSAEEARRNAGELIPFDAFAGSERRQGWFSREPLGIIAAITPYNDPLNLVAHKIGPAIAGGNAVILKPSELTPLSAIRLVAAFEEAGLPPGVITVAVGDGMLGQAIVSARDVRMVSFTGGFATGERIAAHAGLKKLAMDLGGNAPVIVMADADLPLAVSASVSGAYWAAGQNCVGTQRILVQRPVYEAFRCSFVAETEALSVGDPADETVDVGPLITVAHLDDVRDRVGRAIAAGADVLAGNRVIGRCLRPTVLEGVPHSCSIWQGEAFAPVVTIEPFDDLNSALTLANKPDYSLHAGIFTRDIETALRAAAEIDAGGIMINDSSDYRFDAMPFGGYKYGSMGREGVRFAYEDMTQTKVVCFSRG